MEFNLKRKFLEHPFKGNLKKIKHSTEGFKKLRHSDIMHKSRITPRKILKASPIPRLAHSQSFSSMNVLNCSLRHELWEKNREKVRSEKENLGEKKKNSKSLKRIGENEEFKFERFKARPLPPYKSPLKPAKSLKKLTIPIEPVFQTDIRAHLRQLSHSINRNNEEKIN